MGKINLKNFIERERRLDRIVRFSAHSRIRDQSVSEHSFHCAIYAMILADMEEKIFGKKVDKERVLKSALLHDLEECLTGDIIHSFKYTDKNLAGEIEKVGQRFLLGLLDNLPPKISKNYLELWKDSRDAKTIEGKIVEAADKLEGLFYTLDEFSMGNKKFKNIIKIYLELLGKINLGSVKLILKEIKKGI
ncbi:MAG: HD domain-containing protein [Candidatus Pacebacteria bacterium]|nr:HD domain-containing protein [Candidatus Paceibacterota bacterium]